MTFRLNRSILGMVIIISAMVLSYKVGSNNSIHLFTSIESPIQKQPKLLLSSGLTGASEAELRVTFWFEQENEEAYVNLLNQLPQNGWEWRTVKKEVINQTEQNQSDKYQAITIHGYRLINKNEEAEVLSWYPAFSQQVQQAGGIAYLDERVSSGMDVEAYFSQNNITPKQWIISGKTSSLAGYSAGPFTTIQAGRDKVNIQLLSRSSTRGENTVLAIPALLEEF
ncbi:hypothetical protein ACHOLT_04210 [Desulfitobacterium sp. Sab5]|uniref:hypothetical protein n=1 Tax=Desulfitobacterium nosdiversum TaxID=3375356 RepID=UPI003CEF2991